MLVVAELKPLSDGTFSRAPKTSELIARRIVNYIIDNELEEGHVLPTEKELVESFGVGRTTLREALRLLETRGVLTIRPGPKGGPVVRRPRPDDLREALTLNLQFAEGSLADVLEAREALEPMVARLAAERISEEDLQALRESVSRMRDHLDDHDVFLEENQRFHGTIVEASGSVVLRIFNETLKSIADGAIVGVEYDSTGRAAVADAHERVSDALSSGDPQSASKAMQVHLEEAGDYWRRKYPSLVQRGLRWIH